MDNPLTNCAEPAADEHLTGMEAAVWIALERRAWALSVAALLTAGLATAVVTTISFSDARTAAREAQLRTLLTHGSTDNGSPVLEGTF